MSCYALGEIPSARQRQRDATFVDGYVAAAEQLRMAILSHATDKANSDQTIPERFRAIMQREVNAGRVPEEAVPRILELFRLRL